MSDKIAPRLTASVVLCTYNGAAFLEAQLESLLAQTRLPRQIVVSDDASTDGTADIIDAFTYRATALGIKIDYVAQPINIGYVANFSRALSRVVCDLVFLCDQDDIWHADKLEAMQAAFETRPDLLLLHANARLVNGNLSDLGVTLFQAIGLTRTELDIIHEGHAFNVLIRRSAATGATLAFRRDLIKVALPVPAGWIHDEWIAIVASVVGVVDALELTVIDYRQHGRNEIGARPRTLADRWRDLIRARGMMFQAEVARMQALSLWLGARGGADSKRRLVERRIDHFQARLAMDRRRFLGRLPAIAQQWREGNYALFSNGARSVLRDFFRRR